METGVTRSPILAVAAWLLPENEHGDAILGDLEETYTAWRTAHGATSATLRLLLEVAGSVPALIVNALLVHGRARVAFRTIPAVIVGHLVLIAPLAATGGIGLVGPRELRIALAVVSCLLLAMAGGWVAAALAGAAPRQHGLLTGVGLASLGAAAAWSGGIDLPLWLLLVIQAAVISAATYGGARYRRSMTSTAPS
jgi:hypothetical protein